MSGDLSWQCHSCGKVRGDRSISVVSGSYATADGIEMTLNRRYCNDSARCHAEARQQVDRDVERIGRLFEERES